jgi:carbon starvation protein
MSSTLVVIFSLGCFALGYFIYGNFIQKKVWNVDLSRKTPAVEHFDGHDYVPAKHWTILFGHHFSSIAGAGPIIGPVIACALFGWVPALLWVIIGSIFIGGVHDFSSLIISLRHKGNTVGNITEQVISRRSRIVFSLFLWLTLVLVVAVFAAVTAQTLVSEPRIVIPTFGLVGIALIFGFMVYKWAVKQWVATIICLGLMALTIYLGFIYPVNLQFSQALNFWIFVLLAYSFLASIVPVHLLLQPRDYLSVFILFFGLILGYAGLFLSRPAMHVPAFVDFRSIEGPLWPVMFVLIACGAISGFHSLIASGTTSKQLPLKKDAKKIAFGGMIVEGILSVLAIISVCAGLYWHGGVPGLVYPELIKSSGWIVTFGKGYGQLVDPIVGAGSGALIAIFILNAFVMTTLDSATRIARYVTEETFGEAFSIKILRNKYAATLAVVAASLILAMGYWKVIWPVFGASNQLISALVLLLASVYLFQKKKPVLYTLIPGIFMTLTTIAALIFESIAFIRNREYLLAAIAAVLLVLSADMVVEAVKAVRRIK